MFSWSRRRQLSIFVVFAATVFIIVGAIIYFFRADTEGEDVAIQSKDLAILWSRVFSVREGIVDAAALIENPNTNLRSSGFSYSIKLYDANNILVAVRDGKTFINPGERFLIFEHTIAVQNRLPSRAIVTIREVVWEKAATEPVLPLSILRTDRLLLDEVPHLLAVVANQSNESLGGIEASAILWNAFDEVLGASRTIVDGFSGGEEKNLMFTWPMQLPGVERGEILLRKMPNSL